MFLHYFQLISEFPTRSFNNIIEQNQTQSHVVTTELYVIRTNKLHIFYINVVI